MRNEIHCIQHGNHKEGIEETPGQVHGYLKWVLCSVGFPGGSEVKASAWNAGDPGSIMGQEDPLEKLFMISVYLQAAD